MELLYTAMMKAILIGLFLASPVWASGPLFQRSDPIAQQEFENVYHDLAHPSDFIVVHSFTKAQILSIAPLRVGSIYFCSDCSTDALVVSTGTATGAFGRVSARTTAIN